MRSDLETWVADAVGGEIVSWQPIPAGGRPGFFVDVRVDGDVRELFVQLGRGTGPTAPSLFHGFEIEAEVLRALEPTGVPVPHVWAFDPGRDALLVDRVRGSVWFSPPRDPDEQESVAKDFIAHLARWHSVGAEALDLPSFGPVRSLRDHQRDQLDGVAGLIAATTTPETVDPLVTFSLDWLRHHIPDVDGPVVLVQGDTGPGNFLYEDGKVTAVIDWELAHLGDPMDDIAWFTWRVTQHSFPDVPARLREYEQLSGIEVDDDRVRYYRLNAFGRLGPYFGLADMGLARGSVGEGIEAVEVNRAADGSAMIMSMLHRRMRLEATADAIGTPIPPRDVVEAPSPEHAALYDRVLDQLQAMVGRIDDRTTASMGKAVARQVKYLKELDRNGGLFADEELDDLARLLGATQGDLREARPRLVAAVRDGKVGIDDYLDYHWRRLRRDDHLMRVASGALYHRSWPPLR